MDRTLTYGELLALPEWKNKRKEILDRDKLVCQKCANNIYYENSLKGIFIGFPNNLTPGTPIMLFNPDASNYYLTKKIADSLDIRKPSLLFFQENEDKTYLYASRLLIKGEIDDYFQWITRNVQNFAEGDETKDIEMPIFIANPELSVWTFVRDLHVHHTYYQKNLLPWEYPNSSLQTLCWSCHSEVHATTDIPVNDETGSVIGYFDPCQRCSGAGYLPIYKHVQHGVCFSCQGKGYLSSDFIRKNKKHL